VALLRAVDPAEAASPNRRCRVAPIETPVFPSQPLAQRADRAGPFPGSIRSDDRLPVSEETFRPIAVQVVDRSAGFPPVAFAL
jgi:hypothetical protein